MQVSNGQATRYGRMVIWHGTKRHGTKSTNIGTALHDTYDHETARSDDIYGDREFI